MLNIMGVKQGKSSLFGSVLENIRADEVDIISTNMDCNRDRALQTKEVAERKFAEKDYVGAKNLAQKAKDIFPALDFISLFITIINIYLSKEKIVDGQPDWYGVLGLKKPATLEKKCESYFKLFEDVKAGRDNVVGAEGALQIISEAFCILTDTIWTECPSCLHRFQYSNKIINKDIVCFRCGASFLAVPLPCELHPMDPKTFKRREMCAILALEAPPTKPVTKEGRSKRMKVDGGNCSMFGYTIDADVQS